MNPTCEELQQRINELEKENQLLKSIIDQSTKAAQEELKFKQDTFYRTLIENLPLEIAIYDGTGKFTYANKSTELYFKNKTGDVAGKTFHELFPGEIAEMQHKTMLEIFKTGKKMTVVRKFMMQGKMNYFKVAHQPMFNEHGDVASVLVIGQNVTDQTRQEHMLSIQHKIDSLSNLSASLNTSLKKAFRYLLAIDWIDLGGIYLFDEDRRHLKLIFSEGLSEDYLKAVSVYSTNDPQAKLILKGKPRYAGTRVFLKPIHKIILKEKLTFLIAIPLVYKKEVIGSLNLGSKSVNDIDSHDRLILESIASRIANLIILVKTREQLVSANLKLNKSIRSTETQQQLLIQKSRLESLGELTAGLAHEVNQPISVISLVMENIKFKLEHNTASEQYLTRKFNTISQNIDKIRKLIDHFRIFSRDQGSIMFKKVDVNQVITDSLSMIESQLNNHQITVVKKLCLNLGFTLGNPARLEQVMLNLLSNARDALDEKEKKLKSQDYKKIILIKTYTEKKRIIIKISDRGMGIRKENLDRIYDPFFTTKGEGQGTGLGLAIVYGIVTEMKGEIRVSSEVMSYTEFTISLPEYKNLIQKS